jgi:hypothetical protein
MFGKQAWLERLGVYDFTQHNRQWLGIVFLVSVLLFCVDRGIAVFRWINDAMFGAKIRKDIIKNLESLTEDEKKILRFYITLQTKTNSLRYDDGVVRGLEAKFIIFRSSQIGNMIDGFAYNISDFAWDYLNKNQHLLVGATNFYRTDKRKSPFDIPWP